MSHSASLERWEASVTEEEALVPGSVKGSPQLYLTRLETLGPLSGLAVTQAAHLKAKINIH